jgi:hypothetical protein
MHTFYALSGIVAATGGVSGMGSRVPRFSLKQR